MLKDLFSEPLFIEALAAGLILIVIWMFVRTLRGVAERLSRRRALREFVTGVDLYFKGEYEAARDLLAKVIERDPENSEARILLGDACRELGDLAEAHKHHYQVAKVFGQDLPRNRLSLGTDLLEMGRGREAIGHLEQADAAVPDDRATVELLLRASIDAGEMDRAVGLAKRLDSLADASDGERTRRLRASVCVKAGRELVDTGQVKDGTQLLRKAIDLNPALVAPRLELVRAAWMHGTSDSAGKEFQEQLAEMGRLAQGAAIVFEPPAPARPKEDAPTPPTVSGPTALPAPESKALPAPGERVDSAGAGSLPAVISQAGTPEPVRPAGIPDVPRDLDAGSLAGRLLPREAVYVCAKCGRGEVEYRENCVSCGAFGSLAATDLSGLVPVPDIKEAFDEIQENRAFVRSLIRRAGEGDARAADRLVDAGPRVVVGIFREMVRVPDNAPLVRVLGRFGPDAFDKVMEGYQRASSFSTRRLVREGVKAFRSLDDIVVRVLVRMGPGVREKLEPLLEAGERELRTIALDVLIRLGAAERVEEMRFVVPPKDILERLNHCPEEDLAPFLDACPKDGYLLDQILVDRTFLAEVALVRALARPGNREKLRKVLIARGFSGKSYEALEEIWSDPAARLMVRDVVRSYGRAAADHLLRTYTTMTIDGEVREEALGLYMDLGGDEIERLVERLTEGDKEAEHAMLRVVTAFGNRAVPVLVKAYGKTGLLEKVGLNRRRLTYRKIILFRAMAEIGTYDAVQGLRGLLPKEADPELRRRIQGLLDRLSGGGEQA